MIFSPLDQAFCTLKYANKYYLKWTTMIMVIVSTYELESVSLSDISKTSSSHACKILSFLHLLECQHHEPHGLPLSPAKVASRKFWKIHISARKSHQPHMHPFPHTKIFGKLNNYWKRKDYIEEQKVKRKQVHYWQAYLLLRLGQSSVV